MEFTQEKLEKLEKEYAQFNENIKTTTNEATKQVVAFLDKYAPNKAFQMWALMKLERDNNQAHMQDLAFKLQAYQDEINELKGRGYEVIQERNELQAAIKTHAPEWTSKLLWCVHIPEEPDSPGEFIPAQSKEIAQRVVRRSHAVNLNSFSNREFAVATNALIQIYLWGGTEEEFNNAAKEFIYDEKWFSSPMFQCHDLTTAAKVFEYGEIVECQKDGAPSLITADFEEAKFFYGGV